MNHYCPDIFQNLFIQKTNDNQVQLGFCCVNKLGDAVANIDFYNQDLQSQRQKYVDSGILPPSCSQCVQDETAGSTSRRLHRLSYINNNEYVYQPKLRYLQYNCDNICNLKCIACSSVYSSSWIEDEIKLGLRQHKKIKHTKHNKLIFDFDLDNIEQIYFNGGEPLLTHDHVNVLTYLTTTTNTSRIHVHYNTNATIVPDQAVVELWQQFGSVTLVASIDAIGAQFEYIRHPGNWNTVQTNLQQYKKFCQLEIGVNIGVHNIMYFQNLYDYALENNIQLNFQSDTQGYFSLRNMPAHLKQVVTQHIANAPESPTRQILLRTLATDSLCNLSWISYLNRLDKIRNTDWSHSLAALYKLDPEFFDTYA